MVLRGGDGAPGAGTGILDPAVARPRRSPGTRTRLVAAGLLTSSAAATAVLALTTEQRGQRSFLALACVAFGCLFAVVLAPALRAAVTPGLVAVLTSVLMVVAVVPQPQLGADLWVYATYGRTIVDHGESPYVHPPGDHPEDPWVEELWLYRDAPTFYGPVFLAETAVIAAVGGDSRLVVRLLYQVGAAVAVMASLLLLLRAGAPAAMAALFSLNPVVIVEVVGQGRLDAEIGLALIVATICASRNRLHVAALVIAAAALVKLPAGLALLGLVAWTLRHHGARRAGTVAAAGCGAVALAYLAAGGAEAIRPLLDARTATNEANIWVLARENGVARFFGDLSVQLGPIGSASTIAAVVAVVLAVLLVRSRWDDDAPPSALALPVLAYLLVSSYPSSWYIAWILPLLALRWSSRAMWIGIGLSTLLFVRENHYAAVSVVQNPFAAPGAPLHDGFLSALYPAIITIEAIGVVVLVVEAVRRVGLTGRWRR